jgi:H/ACA ribonucleoprotein complex subunit 4
MPQDSLPDGLIILDKPPGHTSHEISAFVRKITGAKRAGHAGTLDPEVSGVLPVAVGRSTKLLRYIAGKDKTYVGIIKFRRIQTRGEIEKLFKKFTGELTQTPPKMSAVRKVPRKRTVYHLRLLEMGETNPRLAVFEAKVGAGTYIRTLCEDMGKESGGARMEELRRIAVGGIKEGLAVTLEDLVDAVWLMKNRNDDSAVKKIMHPADEFIDLPKAVIRDSAIDSVRSGAQIGVPAVASFDSSVKRGDHIKIYSESGRFVGVGIAQIPPEELSSLRKGIAIKLERVQIQ